MKKITFLLLLLLFVQTTTGLYAQKLKTENIPEEVIQGMEFEYPSVKITSWLLEDNFYVASFKDGTSVGKAYISKEGKWTRTTYTIPKDELPSAIVDYTKEQYPAYVIDKSYLQEMPDVRIHYYIEVKSEGVGGKPSILTFNEVGTLLSRKDPDDFGKKEEPKTVAQKPDTKPATTSKATSGNAQKSASTTPASKPGSTPTAKPAAQASSKNTPAKAPAKETAAKPAAQKADTKPTAQAASKNTSTKAPAAKPDAAPEKAKKEKPEKPVKPYTDEFGNVALDLKAIPEVVSKSLLKKIQRPEELHWFKIDTFFVAKCTAREQQNEVFITKEGIWEKTYIQLPEEMVTGNMLKYISTFYKGSRFKQAVKEIRADKNDKTMVEIIEKANNKTGLVTTILFDKTGKLIKTIDPNYALDGQYDTSAEEDAGLEKYYEKMNMGSSEDGEKNVPKDVLNTFKSKNPRATNVEWSESSDGDYLATYYGARGKEIWVINSYGTLIETESLGNPDNISANITAYIKKEHKGFKISEYYAVKKILDKKNYYKVIINNKKTKEEHELWFTTSGKIVNL